MNESAMTMKRWGIVILIPALMPISHVSTDCHRDKPRKAVLIVDQCDVVVPEADPNVKAFAERYLTSFAGSGRPEAEKTVARIFDSYRGAILMGRRDGAAARIFVRSRDSKVCSRFTKGVKLNALVSDACCDGDPNPPCFLGFSAYLEKLLPR